MATRRHLRLLSVVEILHQHHLDVLLVLDLHLLIRDLLRDCAVRLVFLLGALSPRVEFSDFAIERKWALRLEVHLHLVGSDIIKDLGQLVVVLDVKPELQLLDVLDQPHALHTPLVVLSVLVGEHEDLLAGELADSLLRWV